LETAPGSISIGANIPKTGSLNVGPATHHHDRETTVFAHLALFIHNSGGGEYDERSLCSAALTF
jgi:hypothetical protein